MQRAADDGEQGQPPVESVHPGRNGDPEENRDERRGEEREPRRAQEEPAERQSWPNLAAGVLRQPVQVLPGLRNAALGELEERHLLLVPSLSPVR